MPRRGYRAAHQALRARLAPMVDAGLMRCARCGELITAGTLWDLGHVDGSAKTLWSGPEHELSRDCPAGGNRASSRHRLRKHSRVW